MTTASGHPIMGSKPEKSPSLLPPGHVSQLLEERWGTVATTNCYQSQDLAPRVPILQRPIEDLLQAMLPVQTAVNTKPWQTTPPSRDYFFRCLLLTTETT